MWHSSRIHLDIPFLIQAKNLGREARDPAPRLGVDSGAAGAIILAAAAFEAAVNFRLQRAGDDGRVEPWVLEGILRERGPHAQLSGLARHLSSRPWHNQIDMGRTPWQEMKKVAVLRNELIHYDGRRARDSRTGVHIPDKLQRHLAQEAKSWATSGLLDDGGSWINVFVHKKAADWATRNAIKACHELQHWPWAGGISLAECQQGFRSCPWALL